MALHNEFTIFSKKGDFELRWCAVSKLYTVYKRIMAGAGRMHAAQSMPMLQPEWWGCGRPSMMNSTSMNWHMCATIAIHSQQVGECEFLHTRYARLPSFFLCFSDIFYNVLTDMWRHPFCLQFCGILSPARYPRALIYIVHVASSVTVSWNCGAGGPMTYQRLRTRESWQRSYILNPFRSLIRSTGSATLCYDVDSTTPHYIVQTDL